MNKRAIAKAIVAGFVVNGTQTEPLRELSFPQDLFTRYELRKFATALRLLTLIIATGLGIHAAAASVGMITKVENQAQVGGATAVVGSVVQMNDRLSTGPKSHLEVTFRDQTKLTLGENASLVVDRFVFNPEQSTGELLVSTGVGAFRMATGRLSEMSNKKINVSAPYGALAVRGTDFWWGPIYGQSGALLMSSSRLVVGKEDNRCPAVTLTQSGQGTDIKRQPECGEFSGDKRCWRCPGAAYLWPADKVAAALSQTTFGLALGPGSAVPAAAAAATAAAAAASAAANHENNQNQPASP